MRLSSRPKRAAPLAHIMKACSRASAWRPWPTAPRWHTPRSALGARSCTSRDGSVITSSAGRCRKNGPSTRACPRAVVSCDTTGQDAECPARPHARLPWRSSSTSSLRSSRRWDQGRSTSWAPRWVRWSPLPGRPRILKRFDASCSTAGGSGCGHLPAECARARSGSCRIALGARLRRADGHLRSRRGCRTTRGVRPLSTCILERRNGESASCDGL